ncbi:F0F1 ATP synthase subunit delta [Candidatus Thioglobus sp.]|nr:F0F1 ATP synthase subunit delta [Candidatus Thioglobus sp.]
MELVTIAKPYANAVFEIAQQDKSYDGWKSVLEAAASLVNNEKMQSYLDFPSVTKQDKSEAIRGLVVKITERKLDSKEDEFLSLILENSRTDALPSILALFEERANEFEDAKLFQVISAYKLTAAEEKSIATDLGEKYNTNVSIETTIDDALVGGLVIKLGDKVIDMSIKARTDELSLRLTTH